MLTWRCLVEVLAASPLAGMRHRLHWHLPPSVIKPPPPFCNTMPHPPPLCSYTPPPSRGVAAEDKYQAATHGHALAAASHRRRANLGGAKPPQSAPPRLLGSGTGRLVPAAAGSVFRVLRVAWPQELLAPIPVAVSPAL